MKTDGSCPKWLYEYRLLKYDNITSVTVQRGADTGKVVLVDRSHHLRDTDCQQVIDEFIGSPEEVLLRVFTCRRLGIAGWLESDCFGQRGLDYFETLGLVPCKTSPLDGDNDNECLPIASGLHQPNEWIRLVRAPIQGFQEALPRVYCFGRGEDTVHYNILTQLLPHTRLSPKHLVALRVKSC